MRSAIVVGGGFSGIGKGLVCASTCLLMKCRGYDMQYLKFDPYLAIGAGGLSPVEHGNVWVTRDGHECDLDIGHIERITSLALGKENICTSGQLYKELMDEQERGEHLGKTITNTFITKKIVQRLEALGEKSDIVISEIGGSVDDLESGVFLRAICELKQKYKNDCLVILVAPVVWLETVQEFKTKPLQRSVRDLQSYGINPDVLICRSVKAIPSDILDKISNSCNISQDAIFVGEDCKTVYEVPLQFYHQNLDDLIVDKFHLKRNYCKIQKYREVIENYNELKAKPIVNISLVGKYKNTSESYLDIKEALVHGAIYNQVELKINWVNSEDLEKTDDDSLLKGSQGIIVAPGFGGRGIAGKIKAVTYAREHKICFFGICLGLQCAVIEIARNMLKLKEANSLEFDKDTPYPVINFVAGQDKVTKKAGTMRLGAYECELKKDSLVSEIYKKKIISERHRHRYEVNNDYIEALDKIGFKVSGTNPGTNLVEIMEMDTKIHPCFLGAQFHAEYQSTLTSPHPLFAYFLKVCKS
jgi:CTP synthase